MGSERRRAKSEGRGATAASRKSPLALPPSPLAGLPVIALRDGILFPHMVMPIVLNEEPDKKAVDDALASNKRLLVVPSLGAEDEETPPRLADFGTLCEVLKMLRLPEGGVRILLQGHQRVKLCRIVSRTPYLRVESAPLEDTEAAGAQAEALFRTLITTYVQLLKRMPHVPEEVQVTVLNIDEPVRLVSFVLSNLNVPVAEKLGFLEENSLHKRLERLLGLVNRELAILEIGNKIQSKMQSEFGKEQQEHYLRAQMRAIQRELGEGEDRAAEAEELRAKAKEVGLSEEAGKATEEEIRRLSRMSPASAEFTTSKTYIDWLLALPWSRMTKDALDIARAKGVLDADHYDLEKVKERILEYLAVLKLKSTGEEAAPMRGPIFCFLGPPGVGKTSLGRSIARALGRKFVRISLGGVRDEAEIRGHRRTYVGALPGRILAGIRKAEARNPVFMLDEIDKLGADFRGDPSAALLEVLDPEQNYAFSDHYLEVAFDLSRVMFITTANALDTIPGPLIDRMEVIELSGYTEEQKVEIARRHLIPKQREEHGISPETCDFPDATLARIVREYTREAGLRNLEREIANVCRKVARRIAEGKRPWKRIGPELLPELLGPPQYEPEVASRAGEVGVATGLVWTRVGGEILFIEATRMKGKGNLTLTGQLGDVMRESAQAAMSYVRANAKALGVEEDIFEGHDVHIHVPAGAIPKDGPSAGVTLATAILSLVSGRPVRPDLAMTGEVTLRGKVLPIGGVQEKVLAAHRAGIKHLVLPRRNEKDLVDLPPRVRKELTFHFVDTLADVFAAAFSIHE